ncbi:GNAT family N-acetyltransferase [Phenylobacterium aquaticum]|uniref:GNAT family N-acetyltransferase n=1 Tax=Phenylobacterium aquaticum TaxID=1763816 RepID=UPI0026EB7D35|nr:GNAT family N-acetyltransferase [Phenylobacterium aquaticum]
MLEARVLTSIHQVGQPAWDACFPGALEGFDYLAAVEGAGLSDFAFRYVLVSDEGRPVGAAPGFICDYPLDTTLNGAGRGLVAAIRRLAPRAFTVRLAALGSPCTEDVGLGVAPGVDPARHGEIARLALQAFETATLAEGCGLIAVKDAPVAIVHVGQAARALGYQPTPGMPSAVLDIDFADLDGYLAGLSRATRKDLRRKLRGAAALRIEERRDLSGLEARIEALYAQTRARADQQLENLTAAYFTGVLARMGERAFCVLYFAGDDLIGFNLLLQDAETLLDKFFCMETDRGPAHDLYFISWLHNIGLCLERGLRRYQSGQAGYGAKRRLGCAFPPTEMFFRHRQPLIDRALKWAAPLFADDPTAEGAAA